MLVVFEPPAALFVCRVDRFVDFSCILAFSIYSGGGDDVIYVIAAFNENADTPFYIETGDGADMVFVNEFFAGLVDLGDGSDRLHSVGGKRDESSVRSTFICALAKLRYFDVALTLRAAYVESSFIQISLPAKGFKIALVRIRSILQITQCHFRVRTIDMNAANVE